MSALLETYGKTLIACIVASIMILFTLSLKEIYYREIYPQHNESSTVAMYDLEKHTQNYPKIVVNDKYVYEDKVTIKRNNPDYDIRPYKNSKTTSEEAMADYVKILNNYKKFVVAYETIDTYEKNKENLDDAKKIDVQVFGVDAIDVSKTGRLYQVIFVAKNDYGLSTQKKMFILID